MILGVSDPILSWWPADDDPVDDAQQYAYLKGEAPNPKPDDPGDYRFLVSYGPLALAAGETARFPLALAQAPQVSDFGDNLNDAIEFYFEELSGTSLKKQVSLPAMQAASLDLLPQAFKLYPNFPNPFNPETRIQFDLPKAAEVELRIYNALGQLVRTLVEQPYRAGSFTVTWDGRDHAGLLLPSGLYFYKMKAGKFQAQRKLLLLK